MNSTNNFAKIKENAAGLVKLTILRLSTAVVRSRETRRASGRDKRKKTDADLENRLQPSSKHWLNRSRDTRRSQMGNERAALKGLFMSHVASTHSRATTI